MQPKTGSQAVKRKPKSESLFEELCVKHGIALTRLDPPHDLKWPDYELNFGDKLVVAEVKQIDPNEHDKQHGKALERNEIVYQCRNPDSMAKRVRNAIGKSTRQISSFLKYRNLAVPSILILFDHANNGYTDPYTIQTAMYGWEQVEFNLPDNGRRPTVAERGFAPGNNATIRAANNTQLSALATLHDFWDIETHERRLSMCFYHNKFATHEFAPHWWQGNGIVHQILNEKCPGQFQNWVPLTEPTENS